MFRFSSCIAKLPKRHLRDAPPPFPPSTARAWLRRASQATTTEPPEGLQLGFKQKWPYIENDEKPSEENTDAHRPSEPSNEFSRLRPLSLQQAQENTTLYNREQGNVFATSSQHRRNKYDLSFRGAQYFSKYKRGPTRVPDSKQCALDAHFTLKSGQKKSMNYSFSEGFPKLKRLDLAGDNARLHDFGGEGSRQEGRTEERPPEGGPAQESLMELIRRGKGRTKPTRQLDLREVLADYLATIPQVRIHQLNSLDRPDCNFDPDISSRLLRAQHEALKSRGYDAGDLISWVWIKIAEKQDVAVTRLAAVTDMCLSLGRSLPPTFLLTQISRGEHLSVSKLRLLMQNAALRVPPANTSPICGNMATMIWNSDVATMLVVRIIRAARRVAPGSLPEVTALACNLIRNGTGGKDISNPRTAQQLCFSYNRLLSLLALPLRIHPFLSVQFQQQAQLTLLRGMLEFKPPLPVSREGYRSLVMVQLAHKKTQEEQQWAKAKAISWPPWRQNKLGIEADLDYPGQESRALRVLTRMAQAGYGLTSWDEASKILAGWDTDKSPTIQTRAFPDRGPSFWEAPSLKERAPISQEGLKTWSARITATRSIREAWSCFCSFKTNPATNHVFEKQDVYEAMFRKLMAPLQRANVSPLVQPGDGIERYPEPMSPGDQIFLTSEPPTKTELYTKMLADNLKPSGRLLVDLMDSSSTLAEGLKYVQDSNFGGNKKDVLVAAHKYSRGYVKDTLNSLPEYFLASFIRLLLFKPATGATDFYPPASASGDPESTHHIKIDSVEYAKRLLRTSNTRYLPAWSAFFNKSTSQLKCAMQSTNRFTTVRRAWSDWRSTLHSIESANIRIDFDALDNMLQGLVEFCLCTSPDYAQDAHRLAKGLFKKVSVGNAPQTAWLAEDTKADVLLESPSPIVLWSMVRICGIMQDLNSIISLLRWMKRHESSLIQFRAELSNGAQIMQSTLILVRIFLEAGWASEDQVEAGVARSGTPEQIEEVKALIEEVSTWNGWPTDEEVSEYMNGRTKWFYRVQAVTGARHRRELQRVQEQRHATNVNHIMKQVE